MESERKFLHDLSTPLTTGLMFLENAMERLEGQPGQEETFRCLEKVVESLQSLNALLLKHREEVRASFK